MGTWLLDGKPWQSEPYPPKGTLATLYPAGWIEWVELRLPPLAWDLAYGLPPVIPPCDDAPEQLSMFD